MHLRHSGLELALGLIYTDQPVLQDTTDAGENLGVYYSLGVNYDSGSMRIELDASKTVQPSGSGGLRDQYIIGVLLTQELAEQIATGVAASWRLGKGATESAGVGATESEQILFDPWLEWQWSETVALRASYTFRHQLRVGATTWASSNSVGLALRYIPQK